MAALPPLNRRALLGGLALGTLAACGDDPDPPSTSRQRQIRYADQLPSQYAVLRLPSGDPRGLVVLVHGGFWRNSYGLDLMDPLARDLVRRGFATWNIEYPRLGDAGFSADLMVSSVRGALDKIATLGLPARLPSYSLGHSAGGHLAVLAASRGRLDRAGAFLPDTTISLSGVLDLRRGLEQGVGGSAIAELGDAVTHVDPARQAPAQGTVLAVHAENDQVVPLDQSRSYVAAARAAGGKARLVLVPGGHFDLIDPSSQAWARVVGLLTPTPR